MGDHRRPPRPSEAAKIDECDGLIKDRRDRSFETMIQQAVAEGRIGGQFSCQICGMKYKSQAEAQECCEGVMPLR